MLNDIRERANDNEVIYLFADNAFYHKNPEAREAMNDLNIELILNVPY